MASKTRVPISDYLVTFSPISGSYNYAMVDEYPLTDDADYIFSTEETPVDKYGFTAFNVPAGSIITNVKMYIRGWSVNNNSGAKGGPLLRINSTDYTQTPVQFMTGIVEIAFTWTTNPSTEVAWTIDEVNGIGTYGIDYFGCIAEAGAEVSFRVYRIYLEVNYTEGKKSQSFMI